MNEFDIEERLKHAKSVSGAPRSVVDDVMRQIPATASTPTPRFGWGRRVVLAGFAVPAVISAAVVFLVFFTGPTVRLTLADIQAAVEQQAWIHIQYDAGQLKESWTNLRTGETFAKRFDGDAVYCNHESNTRLWYSKLRDVIEQDQHTLYAADQTPPRWTARSAWEEIVAPFEREIAANEAANKTAAAVVSAQDSLNGKTVVRYDRYANDSLGKRFLYAQLWADPVTRLPLRLSTRLQLGEREKSGKEWSTGNYDFPAEGPADLFDLGVPRATPVAKPAARPSDAIQSILDGINRSHANFFKNYRAIVWKSSRRSPEKIDKLDIIWRDGEKVRHDHHLLAYEIRRNNVPPLPQLNPADMLAWAALSDSACKQLLNGEREYIWYAAEVFKTPKPKLQVMRHASFPLLDMNDWPEEIQWPTHFFKYDFQVIESNADSVAGCTGLRTETGNTRYDYYIDTGNDFVCVKTIWWTRRGTDWAKTRAYQLSGLHRIEGRVVAGSSTFIGYADSESGISESTETKNIDIVPLSATEYPANIFDADSLTTGAQIDGY